MSNFKTDALRPSALPSASLGRPKQLSSARGETSSSGFKSNTEADLQKVYEEWNKRIDEEVKGLSNGLKALVDLANIGDAPPQHTFTTTSLDLQLRTSQLIRSTQNLRDIAHDLKLTLLLSDQISLAGRRDLEFKAVRREIMEERMKLGEVIVGVHEAVIGETPGRLGKIGAESGRTADKENVKQERKTMGEEEGVADEAAIANGSEEDDQMEEVGAYNTSRTQDAVSGQANAGGSYRRSPKVSSLSTQDQPTAETSFSSLTRQALPQPVQALVDSNSDSDDEDMEEVS